MSPVRFDKLRECRVIPRGAVAPQQRQCGREAQSLHVDMPVPAAEERRQVDERKPARHDGERLADPFCDPREQALQERIFNLSKRPGRIGLLPLHALEPVQHQHTWPGPRDHATQEMKQGRALRGRRS